MAANRPSVTGCFICFTRSSPLSLTRPLSRRRFGERLTVSRRARYVQCRKRSVLIRSTYRERASPHSAGDRARAARQLRTGGRGAEPVAAERHSRDRRARALARGAALRSNPQGCDTHGLRSRPARTRRSRAPERSQSAPGDPAPRRTGGGVTRDRSRPLSCRDLRREGRRPRRERPSALEDSVHDRRSGPGRPGRAGRADRRGHRRGGWAGDGRPARGRVLSRAARVPGLPARSPVGEGESALSRTGARVPFRGHEAARKPGRGRIHSGRHDRSGPPRRPGLRPADPRELARRRPAGRAGQRRDLPGHGRDPRRRPGGRAPRHARLRCAGPADDPRGPVPSRSNAGAGRAGVHRDPACRGGGSPRGRRTPLRCRPSAGRRRLAGPGRRRP